MVVDIPAHVPREEFQQRVADEREMARDLQRQGVWPHLWRVVGEYANYSVFDVPDHDTLHDVLRNLPLFPFLQIKVTPLATHPSSLAALGETP